MGRMVARVTKINHGENHMDGDMPHRIPLQPGFSGWISFISVMLTLYGLILCGGQIAPAQKTERNTLDTLHDHSTSVSSLSENENHPFLLDINKMLSYQDYIYRAAHRYQVDPDLIKAMIMAESNFNSKAVSKRGARGLLQLMPLTAKSLGVKNPFDPEQNIDGGVRYFRQLLDKFKGDETLALAAYNAGSRKVIEFGGVPPYKQTKRYIQKIGRYYFFYKYLLTAAEGLADGKRIRLHSFHFPIRGGFV